MQLPQSETLVPSKIVSTVPQVTRGGVALVIRAVQPTDGPILKDLFENVSPSDLHLRFLSTLGYVDDARIAQMVDVDYCNAITFLAFESQRLVASAMLVIEADRVRGEVAISVRSDMKARGIGWTLLQHVIRYARANGVERVESIESIDNSSALSVERDAGFRIRQSDSNPADVIASKSLGVGSGED
jgi:acetyltransferase